MEDLGPVATWARVVHAARTRLDASTAELVGLAALLVSAVASAAALWWWSAPGPALPADTAPVAAPTTLQSPATPASLTVHVSGAVAVPGVHVLSASARVADAVAAAGGATLGGDPGALNLARTLRDGERIHVPRLGEAVPAVTDAHEDAGAPVDLNAASASELEALPGIGPVLAERIVRWRDEHGPFTDVADLRQVSGIGERILAELDGRLVVR